MKNTIKLSVNNNYSGQRLDIFLSQEIKDFTRSFLKKMIESIFVKVNNLVITSPSHKLKINDEINITIEKSDKKNLPPSKIKLDIIFEDKDLIIINKPKGMVVHPGAGNFKDTLVNALIGKYKNCLSNLGGETRPGIVHRIDKDTSGLLVVAKNNFSHAKLSKQFSDHSIERSYICLVWGVVRPLRGRIETLISRDKKNRQMMAVSETRGKRAVTNYKTLKTFNIKDVPKISLIECSLETGRTHQIRVHMKYKGTSILGDKQYGKKNIKFKKIEKRFMEKLNLLNGQALHAKSLGFVHPRKNNWLKYEIDLPNDIKNLVNLLKKLSS